MDQQVLLKVSNEDDEDLSYHVLL